MMISVIIYTILSFLLDNLISCYRLFSITNPSIFSTIYTVISLVIISSYFDNNKKLIYITIILGILFDIIYTNTFILNIVLFLLTVYIIKEIDNYIPNNIFTINIKSIVAIFIYHMVTYIILLLSHYGSYPIKLLGMILIRSIIMTIIYTSISYILFKKIYFKVYDKKIK